MSLYDEATAMDLRARQRWCAAGTLGGILLLNVYAPGGPTFVQRALASAVLGLAAFALCRWVGRRDLPLPLLPFMSGIFSIYFALPIFILERYTRAHFLSRVIPDESIELALLLCLSGLLALFVGYYLVGERVSGVLPQLRMSWSGAGSIAPFGVALGCVGISAYYLSRMVELPASLALPAHYVGDLSVAGIIVLFLLQLRGRLGISGTLFLWGILVPGRLILGLGAGRTWQAMEVILPLLIVYATLRWRIPTRSILLVLVLILVLYPVQAEFRALTWHSGADRLPHEKALLYVYTAWDIVTGSGLMHFERIEESTSRLNYLMTFAEVAELTPEIVPYWAGETYYPLLLKPIPRFIYPEKPQEQTGQTFGHRYGFLQREDLSTSYNFPQIIEFYANFGAPGVLIGMFLLGLIYRSVQHVLVHDESGFGAVVAAVYLGSKLLLIESSFSLVVGGLFSGFLFLVGIHILLMVVQRRDARPAVPTGYA